MPRPPLQVGTWGKINRTETPPESGRWRATARFRDFDGRTRQVEAWGVTGAKAERSLIAALQDRAVPSSEEVNPAMTLAALGQVWLRERASSKLMPQTLAQYTDTVERVVGPALGGLRIREATTGRIDRFLQMVAAKTPSQARMAKIVLGGMMGLAVRHDALRENPVRDVARLTAPKREVRALTVEELGVLRQAVRDRQNRIDPKTGKRLTTGGARSQDIADIVDLFVATGARIGEVLALRWDDIDLAATPATATLAGTIVEVRGRGLTRQDHPKTKAGYRRVRLPKFATETLLRLQVEAQPNRWNVIFPSSTGTLRSPNNFRRQWRAIRAEAGLEWVTPHVFRKTVATILDRERDTRTAAEQLGHAGVQVTEAHYIEKAHEAPDVSDVLEVLREVVRDD